MRYAPFALFASSEYTMLPAHSDLRLLLYGAARDPVRTDGVQGSVHVIPMPDDHLTRILEPVKKC